MADKFSDKNVGDNSIRAKAKGIEQRVKQLEESFARLLVGLDQRLNNFGQMFGQATEVSEALIEAVGEELVTEILQRKRQERAEKQAAEESRQLEEAVSEGYVTPAEVIGENAFIVGHEVDAQGNALGGTGRQQVAYKTLKPEFKEQLLGKGVGTEVKTPAGGTFTVRAVYDLDENKYQEVARAKAEAVQKAAEEAAKKDEEN